MTTRFVPVSSIQNPSRVSVLKFIRYLSKVMRLKKPLSLIISVCTDYESDPVFTRTVDVVKWKRQSYKEICKGLETLIVREVISDDSCLNVFCYYGEKHE